MSVKPQGQIPDSVTFPQSSWWNSPGLVLLVTLSSALPFSFMPLCWRVECDVEAAARVHHDPLQGPFFCAVETVGRPSSQRAYLTSVGNSKRVFDVLVLLKHFKYFLEDII